jgi:microcystin degradation protein MlrC
VAVAALLHEANTFSPRPTTLADFERGGLWRGPEALARAAGANVELAGFADVAERAGLDLVPLLSAHAQPSGRLSRETYAALRDELLARLEEALPADAVLLALHGAMAADGLDDPDGDLLAAVRARVGGAIPVVATLDLHANVTRRMAAAATALVGYHTSPHVDVADTGRRAAALLRAVLDGGVRPVSAWRKVPMLNTGETHRSDHGPYGELFRLVGDLERRPGLLSVSLFTVQPWLDVEELGWTALAVADGDPAPAERAAAELAAASWARREALLARVTPLEEAVERARRSPRGPVVFVDSADSTNSGASGDSTAVLGAVLDRPLGGPVLLHVVDAEAARAAVAAGVGAGVTLSVGGRLDPARARPLRLAATVQAVSPGRYVVESPMHRGRPVDVGPTAVLRAGEVRLVVCAAAPPGHDPGIYRHVGLEPRDARVVQVKSPAGFRAWYEPIAADIVLLDTPGAASARLTAFRYERAPRPLFPLDPA